MGTRGEIRVKSVATGAVYYVYLGSDADRDHAFRASLKANDWVRGLHREPGARAVALKINAAFAGNSEISTDSQFGSGKIEEIYRDYAYAVEIVRAEQMGVGDDHPGWRLTFEEMK